MSRCEATGILPRIAYCAEPQCKDIRRETHPHVGAADHRARTSDWRLYTWRGFSREPAPESTYDAETDSCPVLT